MWWEQVKADLLALHDWHHHLRANMSHMRQSRPDSGLGCQAKVLKLFQGCPLFARKQSCEVGALQCGGSSQSSV